MALGIVSIKNPEKHKQIIKDITHSSPSAESTALEEVFQLIFFMSETERSTIAFMQCFCIFLKQKLLFR